MPDLSVVRERAVLFGAILPTDAPSYEKPLEELARLADTAGAQVTRGLVQKRNRIHPTTYVGRGMVDRLGEVAEQVRADILIADNDLSPAQAWNIERRARRRVVDRSELILDIFAAHARTRTSKVAVELAQLEYALPRLKRLWPHLEQQKGGIGLRGPGESQIESDRRLVKKRITELRRVLFEIQERKAREVAKRQGEFTVSLVGYTNAGKSTLMNALAERTAKASFREQRVEDKLFSTLDTKTVMVEVRRNRKILLSDTVGFIQKIPHHLIASFHATLEEVTRADLLVHVVDVTHPDPKAQIEAVNTVLKELGALGKPTIMALNKIDALKDHVELGYLVRLYPRSVAISALTRQGLDELRENIALEMSRLLEETTLRFPLANGKAIAFIRDRAEVLEEQFVGDEAVYRIRMKPKDLGALRGMLDPPRA